MAATRHWPRPLFTGLAGQLEGRHHRGVVGAGLAALLAGSSVIDRSCPGPATEIEAEEVGASLKWATAKVERTSQRGNGERNQGRERTGHARGT